MNAFSAEQSRGQKMWSAIESNVPGDSIDNDTHHESTGQRGTMKYLRESCYHRIKCIAATILAAFMWKRPLNRKPKRVSLATTTHRKPKRVFDGTSTQVMVQMINKCSIKTIKRELYNVRDPS